MPDNTNPTEQEEHQQEPGQPHSDPQTDWKAEARKWEARAKQNSQAATELEQLKKREHERIREDGQAYQAARNRKRRVQDRRATTRMGRPGLQGDRRVCEPAARDSLGAIQEHAAALNEALHSKPKAPQVHGVDRQPSTGSNNDQKLAYLRALGL
ncbi:hypothetical protein [Bifidobacterium porcinum]|uniref:hypothetical protein n=1 Tax=Bifidobacterium porcinum TaxID=212365 RepID=UPI003991125C